MRVKISGSFTNHTLVFPSLSIGSCGRLALDLYLNSAGLQLKGWGYSENLLPVVGNCALDKPAGTMSFPLEFYEVNNKLIMQIRTLPTNVKDFVQEILDWAQSQGIARIYIIGANSEEIKRDPQDSDIFFMKNSLSQDTYEFPELPYAEYKERLLGAGFARRFIKTTVLPVTALFVYCRDVPVDIQIAEELLRLWTAKENIPLPELRSPHSWQAFSIQ